MGVVARLKGTVDGTWLGDVKELALIELEA